MKSARCAGFTLAELLVVVAIVAITAGVVVPSLSSHDATVLSLAASEAGQALRLARSEAVRSGRAVRVDADAALGRMKLWYADCTTTGTLVPVIDPATRRAADVVVGGGPLTGGVAMTPAFLAGGVAYPGLVFGPGGGATQACDTAAAAARGTPQPGSGIQLSRAGVGVAVAVDPPTGRVTWP